MIMVGVRRLLRVRVNCCILVRVGVRVSFRFELGFGLG